ncbi:regulator of nonsense transcripts 3A-like isoform X2 [Corvus kubaryi]|uniref:regulator of nonsense transcripts 3A-like isoform X2 n=2 Tax=Corvus TaxID=30420 RepID=UPI001C03D8F3|nr:regulator of nonsense transcripts 3A-like isoform X2 [Corvus kubaryi]XP_041902382.1 regulator of nonsense transcripts 3A-like isoform X2 [Corvus kubaryi]
MGTFLCPLAPAQWKPCGVPGDRDGAGGGASRDPASAAAALARFPPGCGRGGSMRSERAAGLGPGWGGGRDKRSMDPPLQQESPRRDTDAPPNPPPPPSPPSPLPPPLHPAPGKQREEKKTALSKVVIRRLPPCLTKEQLEEQLHPLPAHDYFEFCTADPSLYPHLYSRAYINFRNPEDILLFRDRFDGYVFIDNKGLEYPAVVEFAPFQKISKKKLKKKDAKAGSIEDDPEYRKFLESYCADEEKICANPEILLGEIEAKTRELIARRTTPLLEYIKNRKLEKQRIREEKREERRRRELEKKRLREEEKRKRREEERRKRKEVEKQKKISEKEIRIKLLKKPEKGDELASEKHKDKGEEADIEENKWDKSPGSGSIKSKSLESSLKELKEKSQNDSDKEQRDLERRFREKEPERQRYRLDDGRKHRTHYEFDKFMRRNEEELKWGKGYNQDRGKKGNYNYSFTVEAVDKLGKEDKCDDMASKKERIRNKSCKCTGYCSSQLMLVKDRPAMQLYQPGARIRTHMGPTSKTYDCSGKSFEDALDKKYEADNSAGASSGKTEEAE